ncbi:MAG TPA: ubiquinol-cytochrome c reductase iron-sulfur subunit, partial [Solirubrobacteraceae bacterium]|nr:ubiquinol-cytochrome c reductase iron-sulfur subunit [Solirubrobacteraceae bacterium]
MQDRHKAAKSKYTSDRQIPGAFEGETVSRRRFMVLSANGAGVVAAMAFTLPALGFALGPIFSREPFSWQAVGPPDDFVETTYATRVIQEVQGIGEAGNTIAYVRKRNPAIDTEPVDQYNRFVALSDRCMHLGCPVRFVAAADRFICPCHGGVYDFRGMVAGGPPVRPLDRFYTRLNTNTGL